MSTDKELKDLEKFAKEILKDIEKGDVNVVYDPTPGDYDIMNGQEGQTDYFVFDPSAFGTSDTDYILGFEPELDYIAFVNVPPTSPDYDQTTGESIFYNVYELAYSGGNPAPETVMNIDTFTFGYGWTARQGVVVLDVTGITDLPGQPPVLNDRVLFFADDPFAIA
jgi:hypothetical protein